MEKVVYILGAGFSAPMGLPVMSNFIFKAKDMFFANPKKYSYFEQVFAEIDRASKIKNYFKANMFNIEEVLSILEMNDYINESKTSTKFKKFIADVIEYYTPEIHKVNLSDNWENFVFGDNHMWNIYGTFVANLLDSRIDRFTEGMACFKNKGNVSYSVISFNYDMLIEIPIFHLQNEFLLKTKISRNVKSDTNVLHLAKLHGSIDGNNIVPPTWNKYSNSELLGAWQLAFRLISEANYIRILGYSLPVSDSYIKYFFKSAILESRHLKKIDVICRDVDGSVKEQFDNFIDFSGNYRFKNGNIELFLNALYSLRKNQYEIKEEVMYDGLENMHEHFMTTK